MDSEFEGSVFEPPLYLLRALKETVFWKTFNEFYFNGGLYRASCGKLHLAFVLLKRGVPLKPF